MESQLNLPWIRRVTKCYILHLLPQCFEVVTAILTTLYIKYWTQKWVWSTRSHALDKLICLKITKEKLTCGLLKWGQVIKNVLESETSLRKSIQVKNPPHMITFCNSDYVANVYCSFTEHQGQAWGLCVYAMF